MIISTSVGLEFGARMLERVSMNHDWLLSWIPRDIWTHCSAGSDGSGAIGDVRVAGWRNQ